MTRASMVLVATALASTCLAARTFYVDVDGLGGRPSDDNPGTKTRPWQTPLKALAQAAPGDTVVFRGGTYRLPRTLHTSDFRAARHGRAPIALKSHSGETAIITILRPISAAEWMPLADQGVQTVYRAQVSGGYRVSNVVENGIPLRRARSQDPRNSLQDTPPESLTGAGQWCASIRQRHVWVRTRDGHPPGDRVELCDVGGFGANGNLMYLQPHESGDWAELHLVFERLVLETGFHGLLIRTGFVELRDCRLRKSFGDLLNSNSGRLVVEGCEFEQFGESAIDVTGPGPDAAADGPRATVIRNCDLHHSAQVRWPGQKGYNAVMLKGGCEDAVVEGCRFHDMLTTYGALTLGGASGGGKAGEGIGIIARNNIFRQVSGPYVVLFAASRDCSLVNNLFADNASNALVHISRSKASDPTTHNVNPRIANNILHANKLTDAPIRVPEGSAVGLVVDCNLLFDSGRICEYAGQAIPVAGEAVDWLRGNIIGQEPLFRAPEELDWRPVAGSPVIDRGADIGRLAPADMDGVARPQGKGYDIGPFEWR